MKMESKEILIGILSIIVIVLFYVYITNPIIQTDTITKIQCQNGEVVDSVTECPTIAEEKGLVDAMMREWGFNINNENELLFSVDIYNYGYSESKNVNVRCDVWEADIITGIELDDTVDFSVTENIGNIASNTWRITEVTASNTLGAPVEYHMASCQAISCDNCELLSNRLP